ncbi:hypothetical protein [Bacillus smithii]|nr:hypothetical protein [Bacillus smithii]MED1455466.1 hypothetical protein [Bacillus smithii]
MIKYKCLRKFIGRIVKTAFSALVDPFVSWLSVLMARRDCSGISGFIGL